MPKLNNKDDQTLAATREIVDRHHVALSVLARGENSPYMTEELKAQLKEAATTVEPYTIAVRSKLGE